MANRSDPSRAPTETSTNRRCPPRKEIRWRSEKCVHRAASNLKYCRPDKRAGLKKSRATAWSEFWAAGSRRSGACADSRLRLSTGAARSSTLLLSKFVHPDTLTSMTNYFWDRPGRCEASRKTMPETSDSGEQLQQMAKHRKRNYD